MLYSRTAEFKSCMIAALAESNRRAYELPIFLRSNGSQKKCSAVMDPYSRSVYLIVTWRTAACGAR